MYLVWLSLIGGAARNFKIKIFCVVGFMYVVELSVD